MIGRKFVTAYRLVERFGVGGLIKGVRNKLTGRNLLDDMTPAGGAAGDEYANAPSLFDAACHLLKEPRVYPADMTYSCTIVVPVYNGMEHLKRLFPTLALHTPPDIEVLLVNDGSPDPEILPFLRACVSKYPRWRLIDNRTNCGFVKTVNTAMAQVKTDYAILLNTDTMVPSGWIPRMLTPMMENERVASTTPFTNAGVFFSFPHFGEDNQPRWDLEEINRAFSCVVSDEYARNEIPSGTGFCMGISMACWKEVGELDFERFGKGYGEENDWCFRAVEKGWRHLLVPNLFVHHFHGGSFQSEEKKKLSEAHGKILRAQYPQMIKRAIPQFAGKDPWRVYRNAAAIRLAADNALLYVDIKPEKADISGAVDFADKELDALKESGGSLIIARYVRYTKRWLIVPYTVDPAMEIPMDDVADLWQLFRMADIRKVIVNNLAYCENAEKALLTLSDLRKAYDFRMEYRFHDHLSVCPNFFLINADKQPCDPATTACSSDFCKDCLRRSIFKAVQRDYLAAWRAAFSAFFDSVDQGIFFSECTKRNVCAVYPQMEAKAVVRQHTPLLRDEDSRYVRPEYNGQWNIAFVGNFCTEKGADYFLAVKEMLDERNIKTRFLVIGKSNSSMHLKGVDVLGRYDRENLGRILTENEVHLVLSPAICSETFGYVAQELMLLNVPFVVFPVGAPQERIRATGYRLARVAQDVSAESLADAADQLLRETYQRSL